MKATPNLDAFQPIKSMAMSHTDRTGGTREPMRDKAPQRAFSLTLLGIVFTVTL